jgi:hypothetical protein
MESMSTGRPSNVPSADVSVDCRLGILSRPQAENRPSRSMFKLATAATFQSPMLPCVVVAVVGLVVQGPGPTADSDLMLASVMGRR